MSNTQNKSTAAPVFGPYSPMRQAGDFYFTAGQVGVRDGKAHSAVREQTIQVLENLKIVLAGAGLGLDDVVKTTVYVTDLSDFAVVNEVYVTYFDESRPARSTVGVKELPRLVEGVNLKVEIEAVAYKGASHAQQ